MKNTLSLVIVGIAAILGVALWPRSVWATPARGLIYETDFKQAEKENNLPAGLLSRMAYQESRYDSHAQGASGEIGIMQIIPKWHPGINPANPIASIHYVGQLMRQYYNRFGTWEKALAAYNWGPTALTRYGIDRAPASTKRYIHDVLTDIGLR